MTYTGGEITQRKVSVGGKDRQQLLAELDEAGVELNEYARTLFGCDGFTTLSTPHSLVTVELTVKQLGFAHGASTLDLYAQAESLGLGPAPLELGPHLRLQYLERPEGCWGYLLTERRAPPGSITVTSVPLSEDDQFSRGFYLRRIKGTLWLRGYCCSDTTVWDADDRLVFCRL